ncbi:MAG: DUF3846 domain-containing protein [Clostridia bacterium]|nr:DUF3846 domain-containing protein [Clostridia bacterium]
MRGTRMLVIEPGLEPREAKVGIELRDLQKAVGGYIECCYPFEDNALIIDNEEGKLIGLPGNRKIGEDIIAGTFLIAGDDGKGGFADLSDDQIREYTEQFRKIETFTRQDIEKTLGFTFFEM